jgi:hypothetical protein
MKLRDLPATTFVIGSNNPEIITNALAFAMPCKTFTHFGIVEDGPHSMRILTHENCLGTEMVAFPKELWPLHMARELERLTNTGEARYGPAPHPGMARGWEVRKGTLGRNPIVVVFAKWF